MILSALAVSGKNIFFSSCYMCCCCCCCCCQVASVMSNSVRPHRRQPTRLPHLWDSPGQNTGVGSSSLLQGIFPTQESNTYLRQWHPTPVLLPGKSHGWRSLVGCSPWGCKESDTTGRLHFHFSLSCIGEGNGTPLQCSCLENPRDGGAWWAAVYGVAQSRT